ncbi:MAG: alpha-galactosidase [Pararhizobium sp.]
MHMGKAEAALDHWRLDTPRQTLVLAADGDRLPFVAYWGRPLASGTDITSLVQALARPLANNTLDSFVALSLCPEEGRGFQGQPGIVAHDAAGRPVLTQFRLSGVEAGDGALLVTAHDMHYGLTYRARFTAHTESNVIEASAELAAEEAGVRVTWLSAPVMPLPETAPHFIEFAGRWTQEFGARRVPFTRGVHLRENRRGRTGQDHFPAVIVPDGGCTNLSGEARALHFGFSGVHRLLVEEMADGRRQMQAGIAEPAPLAPGEVLFSETAYLAFSAEGLNGISQAFQEHVRQHVVRFAETDRPRPVHYNCWEAVYFDHRLDELKDLADRAAAIGAERFVLDDGWFGKRDDDTTSLGDWFVDRRKFPDGLTPLIDHVEGLGMRFGLWVEPEMVNLDSELARAHPDWIIMPEGRAQLTGRGQHVLDLTNPAVTGYLYERLDALLSEYRIDYFKWDMNRDLTLAVDRAGHGLLRRQTQALYALIERLHAAHPAVEIESCSSGGARIDYGILKRTQRVWLSDSNDAHERWLMQHQAMLFLPPEIVGSHVGPRHCHTSGRVLDMSFRAGVAATGHMGFEMDLRELDAGEEATLKRYTQFYKDNRVFLHSARQHRLEPAGAETVAHMSVDAARSRFLLFSATVETLRNETAAPLRLAGLDPRALYRVTLWNRDEITRPPTRRYFSPLTAGDGLVLSGETLMQSGIVLPLAFPDHMWIVEGHRVESN